MKYFQEILLSFVIIFSSCVKEIDNPAYNSVSNIVVNSIINPDSTLTVHLSKTYFPYESILLNNFEIDNISRANVKFYEKNNFIGNAVFNDAGYYTINYKPKESNLYRIEISTDEFIEVKSTTKIPGKVPIDKIEIVNDISENDVNDSTIHKLYYKLFFNDPVNETNYYLFDIPKMSYQSNDPVIGTYDWSSGNKIFFIFEDILFNGSEYALNFWFEVNEIYFKTEIRLYSINEDFYKYLASYNLKQEVEDEDNLIPLVEPVSIYENIEGGLGIFAAYNLSVDSISYNP
ncbi:MAG: DUF4249 domain-containing protein [Chlorobi bacterium]|nr:DUF4249 domain-containing protein [Chlorobiota bacterium]